MALADVKTKIEEDAKKLADDILKKAKEQADEILAKAKEEARQIQEEWLQRANVERENVFKRREIVANLDLRKLELAMKRSLIEEILNQALVKLCSLNKERYSAFVEKLLKLAVDELKSSEGIIYIGENEKVITPEWVVNFNKQHNAKIILAGEPMPFKGGFVLNVGDIDINCSFDMLITNIQDELELVVAKELFSD